MTETNLTRKTRSKLGSATLEPDRPIVAGQVGTWTVRYTVGGYGIDEGGTIKLARRFAADWDQPQFDRPEAPAYTSVTTDGPARLRARYDVKGHHRPWRCIVIDVYDGSLWPGETVSIVLGDPSQGSPGIRAQTFLESAHEFRVLIDPTNAALARPILDSPHVPVVAGQPIELVCLVPTQAQVGQPVEVFVKGQDKWTNPTPPPEGMSLDWEGDDGASIEGNKLTLAKPGHGHVVARAGGLTTRSNPITAHDQKPTYNKYWADLHAQSDATVGTGSEEEYFAFARDRAHLDVASHQGNDFQMTDEDWARLNDTVRRFHDDHRFVVLPGYEWSANTPAGGDRNVIYRHEDLPIHRSSHWQVPEIPEDDQTPAHPLPELHQHMHEQGKEDVLMAAHVGGRYADIRKYFDDDLERLVEIVSCWGVFEWMLWDALDEGYLVGVMCNSDGHKGRPGAEGPGAGDFGIHGGLTCILSPDLTRQNIFEALKARRCYGTTGARMDLSMTVDGEPMGAQITSDQPVQVEAGVHGVGPVDSLTLFQDNQPIETVYSSEVESCRDSRRVRVSWRGARMRGRGRRITWDGDIQVQQATINQATPFSIDSPADGITSVESGLVTFQSRTTGDTDGINLWLDQAHQGSITVRTEVGTVTANLTDLDTQTQIHHFDGLDTQIRIERYPESPATDQLTLNRTLEPPPGRRTALLVKAVQCDGHMAWSSPVYVTQD